MRLVLVDGNIDRVCGDTLSFAAHSIEWMRSTTRDRDVEAMSKTAARLFDESIGKTHRVYNFASFAPEGKSDGYFIYLCDDQGDRAIPVVSDISDEAARISAVLTSCFYVGYVLSTLLVI